MCTVSYCHYDIPRQEQQTITQETVHVVHIVSLVQEAVKGSQGAGRVDDALDSTIEGNEPVAEASKSKGPARPAGAKGRKKGRR